MNCDSYNACEGDLNKYDGYDCRVCKNKGFVSQCKSYPNRDGSVSYGEVMVDCKCMGVRRSIRRIKRSGLSGLLERYTFKSFKQEEEWQKKVYEKAANFCKDTEAKVFYIGGAVGSGKSHICTAICGYFLRHERREVRYMLWRDEIVAIKAVVNDEAKYHNAVEELKTVDVLYIDDFFKTGKSADGMTPPTQADIQIAYEVINYRYNNRLTTIISSERYLGEVLDIDEATGSRILEMVGPYAISIGRDGSKNQRKKIAGLNEIL